MEKFEEKARCDAKNFKILLEKKTNKQAKKTKTETKNQKKKTKTKTEKKLTKINQITACTIVGSVKTLRHARTHHYEKWETELLNMRLSCTLRSKSLDLIRDFCESPKSGTSDIGDYQSLVLRFVKITMLLNHGNVGDRPNSLKKSPRASLAIVAWRISGIRQTSARMPENSASSTTSTWNDIHYASICWVNCFRTRLRLYEALNMAQERASKKCILLENSHCSLVVAVFIQGRI